MIVTGAFMPQFPCKHGERRDEQDKPQRRREIGEIRRGTIFLCEPLRSRRLCGFFLPTPWEKTTKVWHHFNHTRFVTTDGFDRNGLEHLPKVIFGCRPSVSLNDPLPVVPLV
jgi:hypothetical protein